MSNNRAAFPPVRVVSRGLTPYAEGLELQLSLHSKVLAGELPCVIALEHLPTLTLGKNAQTEHMLFDASHYEKLGIEVHQIDRGGEVTAHEPGQLVVYPILPLDAYQLTPKKYVCLLEKAVIATLDRLGLESHTDPQYPGVWIGESKVCAIGIRIKDRVSLHGIALNVTNDLRLFSMITPCGIRGRAVTCLADHLNPCPSMDQIGAIFLDEFSRRLGVDLIS